MTKLVLIDGNAIMHRAFHALPPLTTPKKEPIGAVYGFLTMLLRVIEDLKPTHLAVCFDRKEPTFRKSLSQDYQAHRPEMDQGLIPQFPKIRQVLNAMNIPVCDQAGYEADDLIGTISTKVIHHPTHSTRHPEPALPAGRLDSGSIPDQARNDSVNQVVVVTGDRDILQLVDDRVSVYLPVKGLSQALLMKPKDVVAKLGIKPKQIVDYKALVGDPSDNYKGVPGIGPKTAVNLLKQYSSLKNIYDHLDELPATVSDKLIRHKHSALLSQNLAQIMLSVPLNFDLAASARWQINSGQALALLQKDFGFKTIPRRIEKLNKKLPPRDQMSLI